VKRKEPKTNPRLKEAFMEIVDNQLKDNNPPEARETLARLISEGCSDETARMYIATAVTVEVWDALTNKNPFNLERYLRNLKNLPTDPQE
jgi:hypothetical protein